MAPLSKYVMLIFVISLLFSFICCSAFLYKDDLCPLKNNDTGICRDLTDCLSAQYDLQVLRKQPGLCGFNLSTPIVCCNSSKRTTTERIEPTTNTKKPTEETMTTKPIQVDSRSLVSQKKCQQYSNYVYRNQSSPTLLPGIQYEVINSCNVKANFERGQVLSGEYPHLVSIGYSNINDPIYKCTGALISEEYVLTTASCMTTNFGVPQVVRLGTTIKQDYYFEYPEVQYIEVKEFVKHPRYNQVTMKNDIGLIKLVNPAVINALVRPACLPEESDLNTTIAVGYGSLSNYGQFQKDIKEDVVRFEQNTVCSRTTYRRNGRLDWCAQFENNQCVLDEGSPLQIINTSPYCTYTIVGLLSSWERCDATKNVVVTDVSKYVRWIERNVWV